MSDDGPIIEAATMAAHVAGQYARARPPAGKWIAIMQDCLDSLSAATTTEDRQSALPRIFFTHQQYRSGTVIERRSISRRDRAFLA